MSARAYLNIAVCLSNHDDPFPVVTCVAIHSSAPGGLTPTPGELWANVLSVDGATFGEAAARILDIVESLDAFTWMRIWLREGYEAHQARFGLYEKRRRILDGGRP